MYYIKNKKKDELSDEEARILFEKARNDLQQRVSIDEYDNEDGNDVNNNSLTGNSNDVELDDFAVEGTSKSKDAADSQIEFDEINIDNEKNNVRV